MNSDLNNLYKFWLWFFKGSGDKPGYKGLLNYWLMFHLFVGFIIGLSVKINLYEAANTVLLPLSGIFIGLSFAWAANGLSLLQSQEIQEMASRYPGGLKEYVYIFQTAVLVILITLAIWGLAGLKVFDNSWPGSCHKTLYFLAEIILYSFASLSIRECWHVVLGTQWLLLSQHEIRKKEKDK